MYIIVHKNYQLLSTVSCSAQKLTVPPHRSFDPYAIDWEKFSIIDWIAIGEEAWRKFDPADLECQKRLICEIHQNTSRFGAPAARLVDLFR